MTFRRKYDPTKQYTGSTTHVDAVYTEDSSGNKTCVSTSIVYIDRTAPILTDIKVVEKDSKGYTVECKASDASGVDRVQFPTWTAKTIRMTLPKTGGPIKQ